jgi:hypothetical protein
VDEEERKASDKNKKEGTDDIDLPKREDWGVDRQQIKEGS